MAQGIRIAGGVLVVYGAKLLGVEDLGTLTMGSMVGFVGVPHGVELPVRRMFQKNVGLRGGNVYPTLIRKFEPKPIRIFLQDGSNDNNIYGGDWWMANNEMERALTFAGYEVNHIWGQDGHSGKQMTEICADAMRWLWKDWPAPIKRGEGSQQMKEILIPGEDWRISNEATWALLQSCPELKQDSDLGRENRGISVVVL